MAHTMNVMPYRSEVSGYYKQINGTTVLYSFPHDVETVLRKGFNAIYELADIGQRSISKLCDSDNAKLNAEAHEYVPMKCRNCVEDTDGIKDKWRLDNPIKHVSIIFFTITTTKVKNRNVNNNRHTVFTDDAEIDANQEEDAVK